ncbi:amylo-alpha-1,6-glucosidase [Thermoclostridium stercorarium]|uniref:amylo-alpha-1,6-glucosidase n=1 Tax=Thermoclostridium stercorarium TaxID=1510 RepID=UPI0022493AC0|nr:amylo-alpha-1,6-glucosidase [Thermoclostridium stercorarium]UZQ84403.1 amylo-alpha-1,6-glucosidase [Thermoclostridium stercorarium]
MIFGKSHWITPDQGIKKEWLITNSIGGFACGTIIGMNARRYHGLLIASLNPPTERFLVMSSVSECVLVNGEKHLLHTFKTPDFFAHGEYYLEAFRYDFIPEFYYRIESMRIEKRICLRNRKNQVAVVYRIINPVTCRIQLAPLINFRDYHGLSVSGSLNFSTEIRDREIIITPGNTDRKIFVACSDGKAVESNCFFYNMDYPYEHERGFDGTEDHYMPGYFDIPVSEGEEKTITLICSFDEPVDITDGEFIIAEEIKRQKALLPGFDGDEFLRRLVLAADKFIVERNSTNSKTVIAGYPWFTDWGRDTMISLTGLTLVTKRYGDARDILYTFAKYEKDGLIPNLFPDEKNEPAYNTVDAALWFFEAVYKYLRYTGDMKFVKEELLTVLKRIFKAYREGTVFNIKMDDDFLIYAGNEHTQLTWMDAKVDDWVVTPRHGKAVEINALWYNAAMVMSYIFEQIGENNADYSALAEEIRKSFIKLFWNANKGCLYDVVNEKGKDDKIRPNQILAVSLSFPVLDGELAKSVVDTVYRKLYTAYGLRSLSSDDPEYKGIYIGDRYQRDGAYHQGTVWVWPLGQFITAYARVYRNDKSLSEKLKAFFIPFHDHLRDACIGNISEIFDGNEPLIARGCFAQAWSVAEILRAYAEDYLPLVDP